MSSEPTSAQPALLLRRKTRRSCAVSRPTPAKSRLGRLEALPVAGLVSKPLTKEKLDTVLQLHFQRRFPAA